MNKYSISFAKIKFKSKKIAYKHKFCELLQAVNTLLLIYLFLVKIQSPTLQKNTLLHIRLNLQKIQIQEAQND